MNGVNRLRRADLKMPLPPGLRPATKLDLLRARQAKAAALMRAPRKSRISSTSISRGTVGTRFSAQRLVELSDLAVSRNPNAVLAGRIIKVHAKLLKLPFDVIAENHQVLVNAANKVAKAARINRLAALTSREAKVLEFYLRE